MADVNLGRIAFLLEGEFSNNKQYDKLSVVTYHGSTYACYNKPPIGTLPTDEQFFVVIAKKGDPGPPGIGAKGEKGDALKFEDLTPSQILLLQSKSTGGYLSYDESVRGVVSISGKDYTLYEMLVEIVNPPIIENDTVTYIIETKPLGFNTYLKVSSIVSTKKIKSTITDYYNQNYQITRLFVDEDLNTKVVVKCLSTITDDVKLTLHIEYIRDYGDVIELDVTLPSNISPSNVNLTFPKLKYNKNKAVSLTIDDCHSIYNDVFSVINKRWVDNQQLSYFQPGDTREFTYHLGFTYEKNGVIYTKSEGRYPSKALEYTDGAGIPKRLAFTSAFWSWKMGPRDYVGGWAWPWMTPAEARLAFDFGSTVAFHDIEDVDANKTETGNTNVSQEFFNAAVKKDATLSKELIDITPKIMVNPNGDPNYTRLSWNCPDVMYQVAAAILPDGLGTVFNLGYYQYNSPIALDDKASTKFIVKRLFFSSTIQEFLDFIAANQAKPLNERVWNIYGVHRPSTPTQELLESLESLYGKSGDDSMWMPSLDEFFEYWYMTNYGAVHKSIDGQKIKFRIYLPCHDNFWFRSISVLLSGIASLDDLSVKSSDNCYGTSYSINNNQLLVNLDFSPSTLERAERYLKIVENNPAKEYAYDDASYFINQLKPEYRAPLLLRLNAFNSAPALSSVSINAGQAETTTNNVTITITSIGIHNYIMISESPAFTGASWIASGEKSLQYTLSAGFGVKTVYVKLKNSIGESSVVSDNIELKDAPLALESIVLAGGNASTATESVTVNFTYSGTPTHYMLSESSSFDGATWIAFGTGVTFVLSEGTGLKTVFAKLKNSATETNSVSDTISKVDVNAIVLNSVIINNGDATTSSQLVMISLSVTGTATHYRVGLNQDLSSSAWLPYASNVQYSLPDTDGLKTVYVQVKNSYNESTVASDSITLSLPGVVKAAVSLSYQYGNGSVIYDASSGQTINVTNPSPGAAYSSKMLKSTTGEELLWSIEFNNSYYQVVPGFPDAGSQLTTGASFNPSLSGNLGPYPDSFFAVARVLNLSNKIARIVFTLPVGGYKFKLLMSVSSSAALSSTELQNSYYRVDVNGVVGFPNMVGAVGFTGLNNNNFNREIDFEVSTESPGNVILALYNTSGAGYRPAVNLIEIQKIF